MQQKQCKYFIIYKCNNPKCSYYKKNLKKPTKYIDPPEKYKYKLHYL